jgi:hypothetical protein
MPGKALAYLDSDKDGEISLAEVTRFGSVCCVSSVLCQPVHDWVALEPFANSSWPA